MDTSKPTNILLQSSSDKMNKIIDNIHLAANSQSNILLSGETGTGKSVIAKYIHSHSARSSHPFISVHCGAIPEQLLESEMFGHVQGSFTGANSDKAGKFELADKGTIFLDEITTMPLSSQIKLLQVIQEKRNIRVGSQVEKNIDIRVIAASNDDIKLLVENREFRKDLYFRLNVFMIQIPPLRERKCDIPAFVHYFIDKFNKLSPKHIQSATPDAMEKLMKYEWPGNIRELENIIERAFILEQSDQIQSSSLPDEIEYIEYNPHFSTAPHTDLPLNIARNQEILRFENQYLRHILTQNKGRIQSTAKSAGIGTRQLHKLMLKHGLRKEEFK